MALGPELGSALGIALGPALGDHLGPALGLEVGLALGPALGEALGAALGKLLGPALEGPLGNPGRFTFTSTGQHTRDIPPLDSTLGTVLGDVPQVAQATGPTLKPRFD
jgi:hypothetical protein